MPSGPHDVSSIRQWASGSVERGFEGVERLMGGGDCGAFAGRGVGVARMMRGKRSGRRGGNIFGVVNC